MKTEKRLTMALSVLVALMMLAVPLASSSNLFVDGGQTNSNGDAPTLGAAGDTLTINLNIPENSLDGIDLTKINLSTNNIIYSVDAKNGIIRAICSSDATVSVGTVLGDIKAALGSDGRMAAYDLDFKSGDYATVTNAIEGQMTANATWELKNDYAEVSIITTGLGEDSEKIKAYNYVDANSKTELKIDVLPTYLKTAGNGYVVNLKSNNAQSVYTYIVTDSKGNKVVDGSEIESGSVLTATYTFDSLNYGTISVNSPIFDNAVTFYVAKTTGALQVATTTYWMVFNALVAEAHLTGVKDSKNQNVLPFTDSPSSIETPFTANDGSCKINSWTNGTEDYALNSNSTISIGSELTLNAEFTTFPVKFMVNGQVQIVNVKYGEFSKTSCPFDTAGMTVWVSENSGVKSIFNFDRSAEDLQKELVKSTSENTLTLIALFSAYDETAYVTFNADTDAYFGDKNDKITKVIVPVANGTTADKIPMPANPNKDAANGTSYLFAYWTNADGDEYEFKATNKVDTDLGLDAKFVEYTFTVNFFVDDNKYIVLYCNGDLTYNSSSKKVDVTNVTGALYDGKTYLAADIDADLTSKLIPTKAGYQLVQWNDKDGKMMLTLGLDDNGYVEVKNVGFSKISANTDLYAEFEAAEYVIIYSGNTAAATNNMIQVGTVGESLNFYSDSTFSNDGYKLKEWNTRPDGNGTTYSLGSAFTLSGEDYAKLSKVATGAGTNIPDGITHGFTLYAIWEKVGTSDVPGDNTDGGNDSNTDTYLLAGILVVIIVLIVLLAFLLRKKN